MRIFYTDTFVSLLFICISLSSSSSLTHTHTHTQLLYVSSNPEDCQKEFKASLMYRYVDFHVFRILLDITIPPRPEATPTTTNVTEGGIIMKIISINEDNKGKERSKY